MAGRSKVLPVFARQVTCKRRVHPSVEFYFERSLRDEPTVDDSVNGVNGANFRTTDAKLVLRDLDRADEGSSPSEGGHDRDAMRCQYVAGSFVHGGTSKPDHF